LALGRHGLLGKQNLYDHSMRAPLVFSGPGVPKGGKSDALCYLFDIFPTVAELTGVKVPDGVEGKSLAPVMQGKQKKVRDTIFCAYRDVQRAVRTDRWKLFRYPQINKSQLFDLRDDPDEMKDLADDPKYADRLKEMTTRLEKAQKEAGDKQPLSADKPAPLHIDLPPKGTTGRETAPSP
jgi:arylsulfatase A-like enzyme